MAPNLGSLRYVPSTLIVFSSAIPDPFPKSKLSEFV
jgi:hypothetical protein